MDQSQLKELLEQKQQNPRLKRIPLNLGNKFITLSKPGTQVQIANPLTEYPLLLLLFGSDWCNITKPFIKNLKQHYQQINLQRKNVQIIYVSLDKNKKDFQNFGTMMPWLGISFEDPRVKDLKQFYNIRSIPYLILLDHKGQVINNDCRADVYNLNQDDTLQKWKKLKQLATQTQNESQKQMKEPSS